MADPQSPFTVLAGNPKPHSRTRAVALRAAHALQERLAGAPGLSVLEAQFSLLDPVLTAWSDEVVPALSGTLGRLARV